MTKANPRHRIALQLDLRIALEAIILNRLERIPAARRQEWLRGLLVQGFRSECQTLRGTTDDVKRRPTMALKNRMTGELPKIVSLPGQAPYLVMINCTLANAASKPFATLGKVIG